MNAKELELSLPCVVRGCKANAAKPWRVCAEHLRQLTVEKKTIVAREILLAAAWQPEPPIESAAQYAKRIWGERP